MTINTINTYTLTGTCTQEIGQRTDHFTDRLNLSAKDSMLFFLSLFFPADSEVKLFRFSNDCI